MKSQLFVMFLVKLHWHARFDWYDVPFVAWKAIPSLSNGTLCFPLLKQPAIEGELTEIISTLSFHVQFEFVFHGATFNLISNFIKMSQPL